MKIDNLKIFYDTRGDLIPIEFDQIPFIPKRCFIVKDCPAGMVRGNHAHYKTKQYLICLKGKIRVFVFDGIHSDECLLKEGQATLIENLRWDSQEFVTGDDLLLVLCSTSFTIEDYIFEMDNFLEIIKEKNNDKH